MKHSLILSVAMFIAITFLAQEFSAQTRKSRTRKKRTTVTSTVPTSVVQNPEIISQESDSMSDSQMTSSGIIESSASPIVQESLDQKLERFNDKMGEMNSRLGSVESKQKVSLEEKQKKLLMNLDILTRAEQRSENLRRQVFEFLEKESTLQSKINQLENDMRPEVIQSSSALYSSMRPEEVREQKRRTLESERASIQKILTEMQTSRYRLEENLASADSLVKRIREKLEAQIDAALSDEN